MVLNTTTANIFPKDMHHQHRRIEKGIAVASFIAAVAFAFTALVLDEQHEMAAGNCTVVAQFLLLTASLFGIDYKLNSFGATLTHKHHVTDNTNEGNAQPQPIEHPQGQ